jgi:hypothetical protein
MFRGNPAGLRAVTCPRAITVKSSECIYTCTFESDTIAACIVKHQQGVIFEFLFFLSLIYFLFQVAHGSSQVLFIYFLLLLREVYMYLGLFVIDATTR